MFCYNKIVYFIPGMIFGSSCIISQRNRSRLLATAGRSALGLFGLLDGDVEMPFYFLLASEAVTSGHEGLRFWSSGGE